MVHEVMGGCKNKQFLDCLFCTFYFRSALDCLAMIALFILLDNTEIFCIPFKLFQAKFL